MKKEDYLKQRDRGIGSWAEAEALCSIFLYLIVLFFFPFNGWLNRPTNVWIDGMMDGHAYVWMDGCWEAG